MVLPHQWGVHQGHRFVELQPGVGDPVPEDGVDHRPACVAGLARTAWTRADALSAVRGRRVVQADGDEKEDPRSPPREKRAPPSRSRDKGLPPPPVVRRRCRDMAGR